MIKEVRYNGYAANPSEYQSADGDLGVAMNLVPEDGGLKLMEGGKEVLSFEEKDVLLHIHERGKLYHYVIYNDKGLYWRDEGSEEKVFLKDFEDEEIRDVESIGNTLVVMTDKGIHYFLWKTDAYKYLGTEIPTLRVMPYLDTTFFDSTELTYRYGVNLETAPIATISGEGLINTTAMKKLYNGESKKVLLYGESQQNIYSVAFAVMNQMEMILRKEGFFTQPFYVRFAFRMYDGTHTKQTPPILLVPNTWGKPLTQVKISEDGTAIFDPLYTSSSLFAEFELPENYEDWEDIVTHVDVFVSEQLIDFTDSAKAMTSISVLPFYSYNEAGATQEEKWVLSEQDLPRVMMQDNEGRKMWTDIYNGYKITNEHEYVLNRGGVWKKGQFLWQISKLGYSRGYLLADISNFTEQDPLTITTIDGKTVSPITLPDDVAKSVPEGLVYQAYDFDSFYHNSTYLLSHSFQVYIIRGPKSSNPEAITGKFHIELERTDGQNFADVLTDVQNFYRIAEFEMKDLAEDGGLDRQIPIDKYSLLTLATHPTLSDLGQSIHNYIPSSAFTYNNRLNIVIEDKLLQPGGCDLSMLNPHRENTIGEDLLDINKAYVEVIEDSQTAYIEIPINNNFEWLCNVKYFAFPHNLAQKLIIGNENENKWKSIALTQHPFLNLAYAFNDFKELNSHDYQFASNVDLTNLSNKIHQGNIVQASTIENPFHFPESLKSSLPVKSVMGLSASVKALSEGQFGQFPLYAFTDEGVWALEITSEGAFAGKQPISRDVCVDADSITQIDQSVLFATNRGVMMIAGSETICMTDGIDTDSPMLLRMMPGGLQLMAKAEIGSRTFDMVAFKDYLQGARMVYDYTHQRIVLYQPRCDYAYVYSFKSKQWGMMESKIQYGVNSYPEALVVTSDNKLVDLSSAEGELMRKGLMVTRALKLDDGDVLKTINTIVQRGDFNRGDVSTILWGSRDLKNWHLVWSSKDHYMRGFRGTPYKYYRIGAITNLGKDESLIGASINHEPKQTNKIR